jgi:hypothetical protein
MYKGASGFGVVLSDMQVWMEFCVSHNMRRS